MELAVNFPCDSEQLFGIQHIAANANTTVIFVPGQPQTRVGPHRLFVELARALRLSNVNSLRFDCRGWGDSTGEKYSYAATWQDIQAAIAFVKGQQEEHRIILLGLCDGATAALLALDQQVSVDGLILLNPYFDDPVAESQALFEKYYLPRLKSVGQLLRLLRNPLALPQKITSFTRNISQRQKGKHASTTEQAIKNFKQLDKPTLIALSGDDLTATKARKLLKTESAAHTEHLKWIEFKTADHTFSREKDKPALFSAVSNFLTCV